MNRDNWNIKRNFQKYELQNKLMHFKNLIPQTFLHFPTGNETSEKFRNFQTLRRIEKSKNSK